MRQEGIFAPMLFDGPISGDIFLAYIERILAPALRPGDILFCDNLSSHKVAGVREAVEARGATLLYLPPYSPDLNPIEPGFSKIKSDVRSRAPRTYRDLLAAITSSLDSFTSQICANFFSHANYATI